MTIDLYRYYDKDGTLLYVGISLNAIARATQHRVGAHWWANVANMTVEHYATREQAAHAEREAIAGEKPLYNVIYNSGNTYSVAPIKRSMCKATPFDARRIAGLNQWHHAAKALDDLATTLDERADYGEDVPPRGEFIELINGLVRSLIYGDCCDKCMEIRYPYIAELEDKSGIACTYACLSCKHRWTSWHNAGLRVLA